MTELMVAIIIVILLLAGLIQIGQLANAHTRTMVTARSLAAQAAMADTYNQAGEATYIYNWQAGPDGQRYTRDDTPILVTNAVDGNLAIVNMANPVELAQFVTNTSLLTEGLSADSMDEFFLVTGYASEPCATLPAIRKLAYDRAMILLQSQACLVWTEGIY
jgi:type II secretory pathway pseudopilin PulG